MRGPLQELLESDRARGEGASLDMVATKGTSQLLHREHLQQWPHWMVATNRPTLLAAAALGAFCVRLAAHWAAWALGSTARLISFLGGLLAASAALGGSACCTIAYSIQGRGLADSPGECRTQT